MVVIRQNSSNQDYSNNADGFSLAGGSTKRKLSVTGSDVTLTGSADVNLALPGTDTTIVGQSDIDTDGTLAANSDTKIASQKATKTYVDSKPVAPGSYRYASALDSFWSGLNNGTANTLFLGDSITYGFAVGWANAYPQLLNAKIMARYGGVALSWLPPEGSASVTDSSRNIASAGSPTTVGQGMGGGSVKYTHSGDSQTWTTPQACTAVEVWYKKGPSQGSLQITIDGGAPTVVDTGAASLSWGNKWTSSTLSSAVHTVKVEAVTGGSYNSGYNAEVEAFNLDPTTEPRVYNASRYGIKTAEQVSQTSNPHWDDSLDGIDPRLVVIHLGTNDLSGGDTTSYQTNLESLLTRLDSLPSGSPAVVLAKLPVNGSTATTEAAMQPWWDVIDSLAATHGNVIVWDLYKLMGNSSTNTGNLFISGGVHPNTAGDAVMAESLAKLVLPPDYNSGSNATLNVSNINASNNLVVGNNIQATSLTTSKAITIGKNISDSRSITASGDVVVSGMITGNVTGSVTGDVSGRVATPVEVLTASVSITSSQLGKTLVYNGTTDITITYDSGVLSLYAYTFPTTFVQLNTGRITIAGTGIFSIAGAASTGGVGQRLAVLVPVVGSNSTVFGTLLGASGAAGSIDSLSDVDTTTTAPTNGQALVWNSTDSQWEPNTISGGSSLPSQTGNGGKYLTTDGSTASWGVITPRVNTLTVSGSTYTINTDTTDLAIISSPTANFTIATSGTPTDGQKLQLRIVNGGTAYTPTWNSIFMSSGLVTLPTAYTASKTNLHGLVYDANKSKWVLMALDPAGY